MSFQRASLMSLCVKFDNIKTGATTYYNIEHIIICSVITATKPMGLWL